MRKMKRAMLSLALCTILVCGMSMTALASTDKQYTEDYVNALSEVDFSDYCSVPNANMDAKFHPEGRKLVSESYFDALDEAWKNMPQEIEEPYFDDDLVDAIIAAQEAIRANAVTATGEYYIGEETWDYQSSLWNSITGIFDRVSGEQILVLEEEPDASYTAAWILETDMQSFEKLQQACDETQKTWEQREKLSDSFGNSDILNVTASEVDAVNAKLKEAIDFFNSKLHNAAPVEPPKKEESSDSGSSSGSGQAAVTVKTPENDLGAFQSESLQKVTAAVKQISDAIAAGDAAKAESLKTNGVQIDTGIWYSFNKSVYEKIEKAGIPVTLKFVYKGKKYSVTIPAGAKVTELCDKNGWCGFLNLAAHYGFEYLSE